MKTAIRLVFGAATIAAVGAYTAFYKWPIQPPEVLNAAAPPEIWSGTGVFSGPTYGDWEPEYIGDEVVIGNMADIVSPANYVIIGCGGLAEAAPADCGVPGQDAKCVQNCSSQ